MTRLYIFNNASRAANYGIGTYIRQLADAMSVCSDMTVAFVDMFADTKEFTVNNDEQGHTHYLIPALSAGMESERYCRSVFYLLARSIDGNEGADQLVFQFNYYQHKPLAILLKGYYPDSRIILTVHYMSWCFELNGNLSQLRSILSTRQLCTQQGEKERSVKGSFTEEKEFLHLADEVIVISRKTMNVLSRDYDVSNGKLHLVYNGAGEETITTRIKTDRRDILFVGRLDEIKGLRYLIDAFTKIVQKHAKAHLVIVGDGAFQPYLSQCHELCGKVSFLGKLKAEEVEQIYQSAYIGVVPSFHEQCSYTVIEMMRHAIPVVGTDSTGLDEMLDATPHLRVHIEEGNFREEDFIEQIATRMDRLLSDEKVHKEASEAVAHLYEKRYKSSTMAAETKKVIKYSLERKGYILSNDFLKHLDFKMERLIDQSPDITTSFFGMSGIGVYLWWRILSLGYDTDKDDQSFQIQEYLIYYLDWLYETKGNTALPKEMIAALCSMKHHSFYKMRVNAILASQASEGSDMTSTLPTNKDIICNALKILNCKV